MGEQDSRLGKASSQPQPAPVGGEWAELTLTWFLRHGQPGLVQERAPLSGKVWTPGQASVSLFLPLEKHWRKQVCA